MNKYWLEQFAAVRDGGTLRNDQILALIDYVGDLELAARLCMSDNQPHRWISLGKVLDGGPKIPED